MDFTKYKKSEFSGKIEEAARLAEAMRKDKDNPVDISFAEIVKDKFNVSMESFYDSIGINPNIDTVENIITTGDMDVRWIIPELYMDAIRLGLRRAPIYPNVIASEQTISQKTITMPYINHADAKVKYVGEAETIPLGDVTFQDRTVKISKIGRGLKIPYEVKNYASLNVFSIFLEDFGNQLGLALDTLAINSLINGDDPSGSMSAPVIGVGTGGTLAYRDMLRVWLRMGRLGKMTNSIIGGEESGMDILDLPEFKTNQNGGRDGAGLPTSNALSMRTPLPSQAAFFVHGNVPDDQQIMVDTSSALIKLNAQPLLVESEKIVSNQTDAIYATLTTGFANLFRDSRIILDKSVAFSGNGFPAYMDVDAFENIVID